jgi:Protein of unknown function (DUF4197)
MPSQLQPLEKGLRAGVYGPQIDELVLSMNRAAERAAPAAKPIFLEAITAMSFDDARKILTGSPTAATEYFKGKTFAKLTTAFQPVVARTMNEVGVTRQYNECEPAGADCEPRVNNLGFGADNVGLEHPTESMNMGPERAIIASRTFNQCQPLHIGIKGGSPPVTKLPHP